MNNQHALIIGGSLGGLFTAHLLRKIGWTVSVFERSTSDLSGRGAGLGTTPELFDVIARIGIDLDSSIRVDIRSHVCLDRDGRVLCDFPVDHKSSAWDRLYGALKRALPDECFHAGAEFERFDQTSDGVTAFFGDGGHARGDLLVGADGVHSAVRRQAAPEARPTYAGYVAWRSVLPVDALPEASRRLISSNMVFCYPEGEQAFSVPLAAVDGESGHRCQFVWFRPVEATTGLPNMFTDALGRVHPGSIPPPLVRPELVARLKSDARSLLAPQIAELVERSGPPILQAIHDLESPRQVFGRVVLLGDAAFVARPHIGAGVTKAALDASGLAGAIDETNGDLDAALSRYEARRSLVGRKTVARGRYLGSHIGAVAKYPAAKPFSPERLMREVGPDGIVDGERLFLA